MLKSRPYLFNTLLLAATLVLSVAAGAVYIPPGTLAKIVLAHFPALGIVPDWPESFATILWQVRLPHTVLMTITGMALAGSGAAYQGVFRNPLADPYLIGVASGAGLGAVLVLAVDWPQTWLGLYTVPVAAFLGGVLTVAIVYSLARIGQSVPTTTLILAGVAVGSFAVSLTSFLMLRSDQELRRAIAWLLGGGSLTGWDPVVAVLPEVVIGLGVLVASGHPLNVMQFGEEQAVQLGLPVNRAKLLIILAATLTTAAAVAFSGIIGFIGLIVPHVVRMVWGPDYKQLIPLSILGGGTALLLADLLARVSIAPQVLPVGIVTSLVGAPFFLWILRRAKAEAFW